MSVRSLHSDRVSPGWSPAPRHTGRTINLVCVAALGATGSGLLALASDLPASPYGPHAGGVWPLAASGRAPGWEGPADPPWAGATNSGPGVSSGHLLLLGAAIVGVLFLGLAWLSLWRVVRTHPAPPWRRLWWVAAAWTAPLLLAAPFASQDVWVYVAQGKLVASGLSSTNPVHLLGHHSQWLSAVDPRYLTGPSIYGPGAVDLSGLFAWASGGHPWIAVEEWRLAVIASLRLVRVAAALRRSSAPPRQPIAVGA